MSLESGRLLLEVEPRSVQRETFHSQMQVLRERFQAQGGPAHEEQPAWQRSDGDDLGGPTRPARGGAESARERQAGRVDQIPVQRPKV